MLRNSLAAQLSFFESLFNRRLNTLAALTHTHRHRFAHLLNLSAPPLHCPPYELEEERKQRWQGQSERSGTARLAQPLLQSAQLIASALHSISAPQQWHHASSSGSQRRQADHQRTGLISADAAAAAAELTRLLPACCLSCLSSAVASNGAEHEYEGGAKIEYRAHGADKQAVVITKVSRQLAAAEGKGSPAAFSHVLFHRMPVLLAH